MKPQQTSAVGTCRWAPYTPRCSCHVPYPGSEHPSTEPGLSAWESICLGPGTCQTPSGKLGLRSKDSEQEGCSKLSAPHRHHLGAERDRCIAAQPSRLFHESQKTRARRIPIPSCCPRLAQRHPSPPPPAPLLQEHPLSCLSREHAPAAARCSLPLANLISLWTLHCSATFPSLHFHSRSQCPLGALFSLLTAEPGRAGLCGAPGICPRLLPSGGNLGSAPCSAHP